MKVLALSILISLFSFGAMHTAHSETKNVCDIIPYTMCREW